MRPQETERLLYVIGHHHSCKVHAPEWEKIFLNSYTRELTPKIYKELKKNQENNPTQNGVHI